MFSYTANKANVVVASQSTSVVDAEKDQSQLQALDYTTWLPFAAQLYHICPKIEGYVLVTTPICPSDLPNRNGIAFPLNELTRFQPPPVARMAYKAWTGCPVHYEHDNEVHERAYGVILDSSLHRITGYGGKKLWKVMGLLAIDKDKHPDIAQRILDGKLNTYSMGAYADYFTCSYCGKDVDKKRHCNHVQPITPSTPVPWGEFADPDGSRHLAFCNAHQLSPIETSIVESPAWTTALSDHILTG